MKPVALTLLCCLGASVAVGQNPDSLYRLGYGAYQADSHVLAVKHLFAYQQLTAQTLPADRRQRVQAALQYSESQLDLAVRTRQALLEHGQVSQVQIVVSGKADAPGHADTVRVRVPPDQSRPRPPLDVAPPAASASSTARAPDTGLARVRDLAGRAASLVDSILRTTGVPRSGRAAVPSEEWPEFRAKFEALRFAYDSVRRENDVLRARLRSRPPEDR